jgi:hypothetical protein
VPNAIGVLEGDGAYLPGSHETEISIFAFRSPRNRARAVKPIKPSGYTSGRSR